MKGRAKLKGYTPPRPNWTSEQRLDECLRIADLIERGQNTPLNDLALIGHLRALRGLDPGVYEHAMEERC